MADTTKYDEEQREIEEEIEKRVDDYRDSSDEECEVTE